MCEMLTSLQHVVVHTGAGISTAAGDIKWSGNESSCIGTVMKNFDPPPENGPPGPDILKYLDRGGPYISGVQIFRDSTSLSSQTLSHPPEKVEGLADVISIHISQHV